MRNDLRLRPEWSSLRRIWTRHPLGIERPSHITVGVADLAHAREVYERLWMAEWLYEGSNDALGSHSLYFQLGDSLIELAEPEDAGTHLARHVEQYHNMIYAVTWKVSSLDSVERYLKTKNIGSHAGFTGHRARRSRRLLQRRPPLQHRRGDGRPLGLNRGPAVRTHRG